MKPQVLILCTANSARSQMAEGWLRHLAGDRLDVYSAGRQPSQVHPMAIHVMNERGIDIRSQTSKHLDLYRDQPFDDVITVCDDASQNCPLFPGPARRLHWSLPDPAAVVDDEDAQLDSFRRVRDELERRFSEYLVERSG